MRRRDIRALIGALSISAVAACVPHLEPIDPIETDRPDQTESATLVPAGIVQVEGGVTATRSGAVHTTSYGETLVRIGLHRALELRIEPLTQTSVHARGAPSVNGLEDAAVGIKTPLYQPDSGRRVLPDVSLLLATAIPTGSRSFRGDGLQPEAKLAAQWSLAARLGLATNLTARRGREAGESYWERGASASVGFDLTPRTGSYVEWYATRDEREPSAVHVINGGLTYRVTGDFQVDGRVGRRTGDGGGYVGVGVGRRW